MVCSRCGEVVEVDEYSGELYCGCHRDTFNGESMNMASGQRVTVGKFAVTMIPLDTSRPQPAVSRESYGKSN